MVHTHSTQESDFPRIASAMGNLPKTHYKIGRRLLREISISVGELILDDKFGVWIRYLVIEE